MIEITLPTPPSANRYAEDCAKYNAALIAGYRVFRLTGEMITADNVRMILDFVAEVAP